MGRFSASASRRDAAWRAAILSAALLCTPALPAAAQTMVMGGRTSPDVVVNENVLDSLGPPPTLPGLMRQENAAGVSPSGLRPFSLHPPRARRSAAVATQKRATTTEEPEQTASAVSRTAIPLGKSPRTAKAKSRSKTEPLEQASADTAAAAPPSPTPAPPPQPAPPAPQASTPRVQPPPAAPVANTPPPAVASTPTAPVPSIVRRYPAGTGAAALANAQPPASSPPAPAAQPAPQAAPAAPAASSPPANPPPAVSATAATPAPAAPPAPPPTPSTAAPSAQPAPAASTPPPQVAARPPGGGLPAIPAQVVFAPNVTDMPDQAKATLDKVITAMKADDQIRIQLVAYASGLPDQANAARRTSLSRAVSVRAYLVEQGVKSVRIDVRAMGNRSDISGPQDRVDIVPIDR